MRDEIKSILRYFMVATIPVVAAACANIGNPSGGARDEDPPIFMSASPGQGATNINVDKTRITLNFNELINVKDSYSKVVVSPPSRQVPRVSSIGKKINVQFDSLQPNTTYTIDFSNAIEDNNEGNKLEGFAYTFSTGPTIDSLRISGMVLDSRNLEPRQGILVGVHENLEDSAFTTLPLFRIAKTDDKGRFTIRGLKDKEYNIFALDDKDNDYLFANQEEDMAFYPMKVRPSSERVEATDTVFNALGEIDTITTRGRTRFLPNDILLRTFNSLKRPQYLTKYERIDSTKVFFKFNTKMESLPEITISNPKHMDFKDVILERNQTNDSLVYWLPEPLVKTDSLTLAVKYLRTDSVGALTEFADTLKFFTNRPRVPKKKKDDKEKVQPLNPEDSVKMITLDVKFEASTLDVNKPLEFTFATPLIQLDTTKFTVEFTKDSVWRKVPKPFRLTQRDSVSPRNFRIDYPWDYDTKYRVVADTLAAIGMYGKPTRPISHEFSTKKEEDYCSLTLKITGEDPELPLFVELLTGSDQIVRAEPVVNGKAIFKYLKPDKYYARLIEDYNGNGMYDTGDYDIMLQPDLAYYYPKAINIKKNWDKEEDWDVFATAIDLQKPDQVKKNKPERKKHEQNQGTEEYEDEEEIFDPTANPFDPNNKTRRKTGAY